MDMVIIIMDINFNLIIQFFPSVIIYKYSFGNIN